MRSLIQRARPACLIRPAFQQGPAIRAFSSAQFLRLNEADKDPSPQANEDLKQQQLRKQEKGEGYRHEGLGSQSENQVAADKENVSDHKEHIEDLQKETAGKVQEEHPEGK